MMEAVKMIWELKKFPENAAIITEDGVISYKLLEEKVSSIASKIGRRCLLFLLCKNMPGAIAGYVACVNHDIVPVMIDSSLDRDLLKQLICLYHPEYFWLPEVQREEFLDYEEVLHLWGYVLLRTREEKPFPLHENLAVLMTTSGSTGSPKLVRQSYENIIANTESIVNYLHIDENERSITNLPMSYVYGLSIIHTHLYMGASLVVTEKSLFEREFWRLFQEKSVTSFGGVPYTYEMLNRMRFFKMNLPSLRTMTQAGGKLAPELHKKFAEYAEQTHKNFVVMYGAAEATARMGYLPARDSLRKYGSMGIAIPNGRFELRDDNQQIIEQTGQVGELVYYGKNVTLGYAESGKDLILGDERHGCLHTGDLARCDSEGYYTIVGRKKRFLKIFGKRTNLEEAEQLLKQHFHIMDVACGGVDDKMYLFLTDETLTDKVIPYISNKLGLHHLAFCVKLIPKIPKNKAGKTIYRELEQYYD